MYLFFFLSPTLLPTGKKGGKAEKMASEWKLGVWSFLWWFFRACLSMRHTRLDNNEVRLRVNSI